MRIQRHYVVVNPHYLFLLEFFYQASLLFLVRIPAFWRLDRAGIVDLFNLFIGS